MSVKLDRFPKEGETVIGTTFKSGQGGKGANQAVAAARLGEGVDVSFVCKLGHDSFAETSLSKYTSEGIDTSHVLRGDSHSGVALILIDRTGENSIAVAPGSNYDLSEEDIDSISDLIKETDILLLQLEIPVASVFKAAKLAHSSGKFVILNPAPSIELPDEVFHNIDLFIPNKVEAEFYSGIKVVDEASATEAASKLIARGVKNVIITLGKEGSVYCDGKNHSLVPARKVNVVDTTAAGDTFAGALASALAEGKGIMEAISFATCASSLCVQKAGAQESIPQRNQITI